MNRKARRSLLTLFTLALFTRVDFRMFIVIAFAPVRVNAFVSNDGQRKYKPTRTRLLKEGYVRWLPFGALPILLILVVVMGSG